MPQDPQPIYGGQAVIEGVMFAGKHVNVTAVRRKNDEIVFYEVPRTTKPWVQKLKKIPILRGIVAILESSAKGSQHLNFRWKRTQRTNMPKKKARKDARLRNRKANPAGASA
ncbi:hypothetical protein PACILC2_45000 [Paenibacillus cisolokensis]|uniref:Uncharacterized protein n=1 Tax=Paenibacillus cisolokensis TaxID=1658519 RepID=A0ABQ4NCJ0_9BACL|nr:hypothetical protein PACILC2_45000 [Paenibacillus cisolokensis]